MPSYPTRAPQPGAALLLHDRGRVLMIQRQGAHGAGDWGGPGGKPEPGETPEDAIRREIREEIGVRLHPDGVQTVATTRDRFSSALDFETHWFVADLPAGAVPRNLEPDKIARLAWIDPRALPAPLFLPVRNLLAALASEGHDLAALLAGAAWPADGAATAARLAPLAGRLAEHGWSAATSADPDGWTPANPAWGQCAVTALLVQDLLGGRLLRTVAQLPDGRRISHYLNRVRGQRVDLTASQFPAGTGFPTPQPRRQGYPTTRDYLLANPQTRARYIRLRERLRPAAAAA
jgi:8-oxo-dGTP pyrophosphatase MutT (NUDIX family)